MRNQGTEYGRTLKAYQAGTMTKRQWRKYLKRRRAEKKAKMKDKKQDQCPQWGNARLNGDQRKQMIELESRSERKTEFAKMLRRKMTKAEFKFWSMWKSQNLFGLAPQVPVCGYIADFLAFNQKLVIEFDGSSHDNRQEYDAQRTKHLEQAGYRVIRFTDAEVLHHTRDVLEKIKHAMGIQAMLPKRKKNPMEAIWAETAKLVEARKAGLI